LHNFDKENYIIFAKTANIAKCWSFQIRRPSLRWLPTPESLFPIPPSCYLTTCYNFQKRALLALYTFLLLFSIQELCQYKMFCIYFFCALRRFFTSKLTIFVDGGETLFFVPVHKVSLPQHCSPAFSLIQLLIKARHCKRLHNLKSTKQCDSGKNVIRLFIPSLSSCQEKATVAVYFGRIRTRLGVVHFRVFRLFLLFL